jgi:hypothetical protein
MSAMIPDPIPTWGPGHEDDEDHRWLDISAWSDARGGELPQGTITAVPNFDDLVIISATHVRNVTVAGAAPIPHAIDVHFNADNAQHCTYFITISFTTDGGNVINREVQLILNH